MPFRLLLKRIALLFTVLLLASVLPGSTGCSDTGDKERSPGAAPAASAAPSSTVMPPALRASYLAARQNDGGKAYHFGQAAAGSAASRNEAQRLAVELASGALRVVEAKGAAWHLGLRWTGLGRGAAIAPVPAPRGEPHVTDNRASYLREDGSEEWYVNGPLGVEQGFGLAAPPDGPPDEPLALEVSVEGGLVPELLGEGKGVALRDGRGVTVARYTELTAFDAGGASLRAWVEVSGGVVRLRVDDAGARYPLRIDPLVWTEQAELTASDAAVDDRFGRSVAVSGGIAIVGAPAHDVDGKGDAGAAYVFVQNGPTWTQQQQLTASDAAVGNQFGASVAVSSGIAIVGAPNHYVDGKFDTGAAYVFVQNEMKWAEQQKLTANDPTSGDQFGFSVAVSGGIAIVGAPSPSVGLITDPSAAYVFVQNGTTWTQQQKLTASDPTAADEFGASVAVSGGIAIVGAPAHDVDGKFDAGAAYVFVQNGTTWTPQQLLTASDAAKGNWFGFSVAVSGGIAIVGAPFHNVNVNPQAGAAYVFEGCVVTGCPAAQWCMASTKTCTPALPNDAPLPNEPASPVLNGTCSAAAAALACQSGVCDTDGRCGLPNEKSCTTYSVCRAGACSNGTCGCAIDADCPMSQWCNGTTHLCRAQLADGEPIPGSRRTDPALSGICTPEVASIVCLRGECDPIANVCGRPTLSPAGAETCDQACEGLCEQCVYPVVGTCSVQPGIDIHQACNKGGDTAACGSSVCTPPKASGMAATCEPATEATICSLGTCSQDGLHGTAPVFCTASDAGGLTCQRNSVDRFDCTKDYRCDPGQGHCKERCNTINDCVPGFVCTSKNLCEAASGVFTPNPSGGCSLSGAPPGSAPWGSAALWILPALAAARRRKRRAPSRWGALGVAGMLLFVGVLPGSAGCSDTGDKERSPVAPPAASAAPNSTVMPPALRASYLAARQNDGGKAYHFGQAAAGRAASRNERQRLAVELASGALRVVEAKGAAWQLGLRWTGLGRGAALARVPAPRGEPHVTDNRASYLREDGSEEWYVNGPLGVEQGFGLAAPPDGPSDEPLALEVSVEGGLVPELLGEGKGVALRDGHGVTVARYTELTAFDAGGALLRAWVEVSGGVVRLRVDDAGALYPLRIDPLVWTEQAELTASDGAVDDQFGTSVAVSGGIAIVGALGHDVGTKSNAGAAYVFVQNGPTWTQQQQLTANEPVAGDQFGASVAVSGGIAIVGAPGHKVGANLYAGAAYVFVQNGMTWTQQEPPLTATDAAASDGFGASVAVSGGIAIVGAPFHRVDANLYAGAAYVFVQNGMTWTQQKPPLTATDAAQSDWFGDSVAVSGGIAIVGAPKHKVGANIDAGAAYVFVQNGMAWTQQEPPLTASDPAVGDYFGYSVAVSSGIAIVGAPYHNISPNNATGAAYVFVQNGGIWTQQKPPLTATDATASDGFGASVAVSGGIVIVGAPFHRVDANTSAGAAYVFAQNGMTWTQQEPPLTAGDAMPNDGFGWSVAVSGGIAVVGALYHQHVGGNESGGAAYVFEDCTISGCPTGQWCKESTNTCTPALPNDAPIPNEPHSPVLNGTCSDAAAALACQSGVCDVADNKCGYPDGYGACATASVCRSGLCSANFRCMPQGSCNVDADCSMGLWCNATAHTCRSKLTNGAAIPDDLPHVNPSLNGICHAAAAALVCESGACDIGDNSCGYADGDGPCTPVNSATVCRSGACNANGTCGCAADADCPINQWCNESAHTCAAQRLDGEPIPTDLAHQNPPLHGICTPQAAVSVCVSGLCDSTTDLCGLQAASQNGSQKCAEDADCTTETGPGFCSREHVCCNRACDKLCEQCVYPTVGTCSVQPGTDLHHDCDKASELDGGTGSEMDGCGSSVCTPVEGSLDGGKCAPATTATICSLGTCSPDRLHGTSPVKCTETDAGMLTCQVRSAEPVECTTDYRCDPGRGRCNTQCVTINDCVPGFVCTGSICEAASEVFPQSPSGGCSLSGAPPATSPWGSAALLLLPALALARRRAPARSARRPPLGALRPTRASPRKPRSCR